MFVYLNYRKSSRESQSAQVEKDKGYDPMRSFDLHRIGVRLRVVDSDHESSPESKKSEEEVPNEDSADE